MAHSVSQPGSTTVMAVKKMTYKQIADDLAQRIASDQYPPGSKLPSTTELAGLYSVDRSTIVRAMGLLHDRGLVLGQPGRGVYVPEDETPAAPAD